MSLRDADDRMTGKPGEGKTDLAFPWITGGYAADHEIQVVTPEPFEKPLLMRSHREPCALMNRYAAGAGALFGNERTGRALPAAVILCRLTLSAARPKTSNAAPQYGMETGYCGFDTRSNSNYKWYLRLWKKLPAAARMCDAGARETSTGAARATP